MPVVVLDAFNDLDTRGYALASRAVGGCGGRLHAKRLIAAAAELCPPDKCAGLVYGSGFENRPRLLERLTRGRTLYGNSTQTVSALKDPEAFFGLLDRLGIAHPEISFDPPSALSEWLTKRAGAAGGSHVRRAHLRHRVRARRYFQRFQSGRTLSVLFAADGRQARIVGFNEQWTAGVPQCAPYCYGGAVSGPRLPREVEKTVASHVDRLVQATGLVGLNGLDFISEENLAFVLEVNPRPTATIDLYDVDVSGGMLALHLTACRGKLPPVQFSDDARAHAIVYSGCKLRVDPGRTWPAWCTDLPEAGSVILRGAPVCSVHARAATSDAARELVVARRREIESSLLKEAA